MSDTKKLMRLPLEQQGPLLVEDPGPGWRDFDREPPLEFFVEWYYKKAADGGCFTREEAEDLTRRYIEGWVEQSAALVTNSDLWEGL